MTRVSAVPRRERLRATVLFLVTLVCVSYAFPRWADWNQNSRFDLTVAIVDEGSLSIDCCVENTGDYALFGGHAYSDKAPGLSFLAVPAYLLFKSLAALPPVKSAIRRAADSGALQTTLREGGTGLRPDKLDFAAGLTLATLATVSFPAALLAVILFRFLQAFSDHAAHRAAVTLTYSLATIAFPYSGAFYAHQLVATLLFAAFALIFRLQRPGPRVLLLIGLLLGYAVISEYPAALIAGVLAAYCLYRLPRWRHFTWVALGGLAPIALAAAYHQAIFGTPWPVAYRYSALWQQRHAEGIISLTHPHMAALWGITGSPYRGLFFLSPVLLLAIPGFGHLWRRRAYRAEAIVTGAAVVSFLAFNSASNMWWGGHSIGPRYLVPMVPFLAWPLIFFLDRHGRSRWGRGGFYGLAVLSLLSVWGLAWAGQQFPEDTWRFPWRDYAWPHLAGANLARNFGMMLGLHGWWSLAPLAAVLAIAGAVWRRLGRR